MFPQIKVEKEHRESPVINRCRTPPPRIILEGTEEYDETIVLVLKNKVM